MPVRSINNTPEKTAELLEKKRQKNREYAKTRRQERLAANLCPDCGQPKNSASYRCEACNRKQIEKAKQNPDQSNSKHKRWREAQIVRGLCTQCSEPAAPGFKKCLKHLNAAKKHRASRKADGKCSQCHRQAVPGSTVCSVCAAKRQQFAERVTKLADDGFCVKCLVNPRDQNYRTCTSCRKDTTEKARVRRERYKADNRCPNCGDTKLDHSQYCKVCYLRFIAVAAGLPGTDWELLLALLEQQDGRCAYSGEVIHLGLNSSLDHILPYSLGGNSNISNLQWVTRDVNVMKRAFTEEYFLSLVCSITLHRHLLER